MPPVATAAAQEPVHSKDDPNGIYRVAAASSEASSMPKLPTFTDKMEEREYLKKRLAEAFRIFGFHGYDEGVAGHITVRDPINPHAFWVNPFGKHFSLIQAEDLILVDHEGKILPESGPMRLLNKAAFMIHSAIHMARPDVLCAAHSHSIYGRAFSTLGRELDMITQDSCAFYNDHILYTNFKGVVLEEEEGLAIAKQLGNKKAAILQNHGILVATPSIEATIFFYASLEKCCRVQLMADAAATGRGSATVKIGDEDALETWKSVGQVQLAWFAGLPEFELLAQREKNLVK